MCSINTSGDALEALSELCPDQRQPLAPEVCAVLATCAPQLVELSLEVGQVEGCHQVLGDAIDRCKRSVMSTS